MEQSLCSSTQGLFHYKVPPEILREVMVLLTNGQKKSGSVKDPDRNMDSYLFLSAAQFAFLQHFP